MSKNDKKIVSLMLVLIMILSCILPVCSNAVEKDEVIIKDEKLKEELMIFDENEDGKLSKEEMENAAYVNISSEVKDLTGLEYAKNLCSINYDLDGDLIDFSPVFKENIKYISLNICEAANLTNFNFLQEFTNLNSLNIMKNYISDKKVTFSFSEISELKKLNNISIYGLEMSDLSNIDKFTELESLSLSAPYNGNIISSNLDVSNISKLQNIKSLSIYYYNIKNISELGNLTDLESIGFYNDIGLEDISFIERNSKIQSLNISNTDILDIKPIKSLSNLRYLYLDGNNNISMKDKAEFITLEDYTAYIGENHRISATYEGIFRPIDWDVKSSDEDIVKIGTTTCVATAVDMGETTITFTAKEDPTIEKTMKITVKGIDANQASGTEMGTTQINTDTILRENGELLRTYAKENKAEIIDTNVKKYVYEFIYNEDYTQAFNYTLTQKNDGTVKFVFNGIEQIIEDAKDITNTGYLRNDGTYLEVTLKGKFKEVTNNVEKIVGSYLVKNDGKTYTIKNKLMCDFKIKNASYDIVVDEDNNVWLVNIYNESEPQKIGENFKEFVRAESYYYLTNDGKVMDVMGQEVDYLFKRNPILEYGNEMILNKENTLIFNGKELLTDVVSIEEVYLYDYENYIQKNKALIVRKDGSVWCLTLSGEATLEKMEEYTNSIYFANDELETKQIFTNDEEVKDVLTGFDMENLSITQALSSNQLNSGYVAKAYGKEDEELTGKEKIFTGAKIVLYNEKGEAVKEYTALVYGDVTGSGNPSSKDALAIIKNNLGKVKITDNLLLEAGRITERTKKTGGVPNSSDALAIVKARLSK